MRRDVAVEVRRVGGVDNLREDEALVLDTRSERRVARLVAKLELRTLGDGVHVGVPHELDGITDRRVCREGHVAKDTLGRGDNDRVSYTIAFILGFRGGRGSVGGRRSAERGNAFYVENW